MKSTNKPRWLPSGFHFGFDLDLAEIHDVEHLHVTMYHPTKFESCRSTCSRDMGQTRKSKMAAWWPSWMSNQAGPLVPEIWSGQENLGWLPGGHLGFQIDKNT